MDIKFEKLTKQLSSEAVVFLPGHEEFSQVKKAWNGLHDYKNPAIIVHVACVSDVQACVNFAREEKLQVTPRAGGHSIPGLSSIEGGMLIDFRRMKKVEVDEENKTVTVEPGCLGSEVDAETAKFGLATVLGTVSHTGATGLILGGGMGWLSRQYGMAVDNVISCDVVLANGQFVTATEENHPDLLWAMKGAGPNFGIVTSLKLKLHPVSNVYTGTVVVPLPFAAQLMKLSIEVFSKAPNCYSQLWVLTTGPGGHKCLIFAAMYDGSEEEGKKFCQPFESFQPAVASHWGMMPYTKLQSAFDHTAPHSRKYYFKGGMLNPTADTVDEMITNIEQVTSPFSAVLVHWLGGGAVAQKKSDSTAFPGRNVDAIAEILGAWEDEEDDKHIDWARASFSRLEKHYTGIYSNFLGNPDDVRNDAKLQMAFMDNLPRLRELKSVYDPENFFNHNVNIKPLQQ